MVVGLEECDSILVHFEQLVEELLEQTDFTQQEVPLGVDGPDSIGMVDLGIRTQFGHDAFEGVLVVVAEQRVELVFGVRVVLDFVFAGDVVAVDFSEYGAPDEISHHPELVEIQFLHARPEVH